MSGHSKWSTIKRQKGANDAKRGALFTKLSKAITIAVLAGGGVADPAQNFRLRLAVEAARAGNMPKENIERAIEKAAGKSGDTLEEVLYEGFGPGGVGIIVEAATDNKNRTTSEVQNAFNKNGGNMGAMGSVSYQFKKMGQLVVEKNSLSFDDVFLEAADAGAEDVEDAGEVAYLYTQPGDLAKVRDSLSSKGIVVKEMELIWKPTVTAEVDDTTGEKVMNILEKLEDLDDVQKTYSNIA
ncbi:MAG TPA: YebC/PmpR family DNA-binding transcriptional regulator [Candidatus Eisenbacteria bacterium]|nr:YebC/PmpR family DNA-binding transcriptional regulator [Candidatus Eisenbacteria bacterium]